MHDGEKIKHLRMIKGYSQKGIAKKLGFTQQAYSKMENRQMKIDDARMKEILKAMQCSGEELIKIETFFISSEQKMIRHTSMV